MTSFADRPLEDQIAQWRAFVRRRHTLHGPDVEELEGHLRDQLAALTETGLAGDEAFLVAVKRMGNLDALSREFAREHSERLWKQLVTSPTSDLADESPSTARAHTVVVLILTVAAALAVKIPDLLGLRLSPHEEVPPFYFRNASLFSPINVKREVLIGFDLLLVVVVGLVLYPASAHDPQAPPDFFDGLQLLLVVSALVVDGVALAAIAARINELGFTPNRVAALGENLLLLVNLAVSAWLYARFLRYRGSFADLERWQIAYLPVYATWAALVVVVFPLVFGFR